MACRDLKLFVLISHNMIRCLTILITFNYSSVQVALSILQNHRQIATILSNRSLVFTQMGWYEQAMEDARECITVDPDWFKVMINRHWINIYINKRNCCNSGKPHPKFSYVISRGITYRPPATQYASDLDYVDVDLSRPLNVKSDGAIGLPKYGFMSMFNINI